MAKRTKMNRPIPNTNGILEYFHCRRCLVEDTARGVPWRQQLEVGWTELGLQVWCRRHASNVLHIDFEGCRHPANETASADDVRTDVH